MQVGDRQEFEMAAPVISVRPVRLSLPKLAVLLAVTAAVAGLLALLSVGWAILWVLVVVFSGAYLELSDHVLRLELFYAVEAEDSEDIERYAISDLSAPSEQEAASGLRKTNHCFIARVHVVRNGNKYLHFKEHLYKLQLGVMSAVSEADVLALLAIRDFRDHLRTGLEGERLKTSLEVFKVQSRCLTPKVWDFVRRRARENIEAVLLNLFLLSAATFALQSLPIALALALVTIIIAVLGFREESRKAEEFKQRFGGLAEKKVEVLREGRVARVQLGDVLTGDVIEAEACEEYQTMFRCLLLANKEVVCRQGVAGEETYKNPVSAVEDVREDHRGRLVIEPMSVLEGLRGDEHLFVLENNSITKFFALWFHKPRHAEFRLPHHAHLAAALPLLALALAALFILHILLVIFTNATLLPHDDVATGLAGSALLAVGMAQLAVSVSEERRLEQLRTAGVTALGNVAQAGAVHSLLLNFAELLELQFQEILYKNMIFDPSSRVFQPDAATLENGRTYESLLAVILYLSMGHFDREDGRNTFLRVMFESFEKYFEYEEDMVIHGPSNRVWRLVQRDPLSEEGLRSWRIHYDHHLKYVISELDVADARRFPKHIGAADTERVEIYKELIESLVEEGKKVKLVMFRSFKKESANVRDKEIGSHTQEEFMRVARLHLEKNMEFAALVIFDNALTPHATPALEALRDLSSPNGRTFRLALFSHNKNENLAGFEHILGSIPIYHSLSFHEKAALARQRMHEGGTVVVGSHFEDIYAELVADLSVRVGAREGVQLPADFCVEKLTNLKDLLAAGMAQAEFRVEAVRYALVVWFWVSFSWVLMGSSARDHTLAHAQAWTVALAVLLIFAPLLTRALLQGSGDLNHYKRQLEVMAFPYAAQLLLTAVAAAFIVIMTFSELCPAESKPVAHMLGLRHHLEESNGSCLNLAVMLGGCASTMAFAIFSGESLASEVEWWRLAIVAVWLVMLLVASVPGKFLLTCLATTGFMLLLKLLIWAVSPAAGEASLKESHNAETDAE